MSLFKEWEEIAENAADSQEFWKNYLALEQTVYDAILIEKETSLKGSIKDLAEKYKLKPVMFAGFLDGINTSLKEEINLDELEDENTSIDAEIDYDKLYYNMHEAKADWLYNLPAWDDIFTKEKRKEIKKAYNATKTVVKGEKIGRNDPCPCGSGKKYKKCCLNK
ncbi:SEC-C metal-binding domain-containing protein [Helicovermis profundi]|uniref:SEC-C metal-binding domain-containing protein n=1 Tax=Helicovermis profundi TaxID=3065157 RepID=A0AAU9EP24_9FIRM|nr:SEC-C metal-binding domain-containing protein [Clostridia bacterium S502]